ncbi:hypothetical protein G9A89_023777 [Geosiphon pyriformis]|nr:hypothetical protein G9A89_023777 [Geosiphon pyriformis]
MNDQLFHKKIRIESSSIFKDDISSSAESLEDEGSVIIIEASSDESSRRFNQVKVVIETKDKQKDSDDDYFEVESVQTQNDSIESDSMDEEEFEIEYIHSHSEKKGRISYLVTWKGYTQDENSWVHEKDINAKNLIQEYWERVSGMSDEDDQYEGSDEDESDSKVHELLLIEKKFESIEMVSPDNDTGELKVFVKWTDGTISMFQNEYVRERWPQKLIQFYENQLKFYPNPKNMKPSNKSTTPCLMNQ